MTVLVMGDLRPQQMMKTLKIQKIWCPKIVMPVLGEINISCKLFGIILGLREIIGPLVQIK